MDAPLVAVVNNGDGLRVGSHLSRIYALGGVPILYDRSKEDEAQSVSKKQGFRRVSIDKESALDIASSLLALDGENDRFLLIYLSKSWQIRDLPDLFSLASRPIDLFIKHQPISMNEGDENRMPADQVPVNEIEIVSLSATRSGLEEFVKGGGGNCIADLPPELQVRLTPLEREVHPPTRESVTTASDLAQFFYWSLTSRHPLILLGVPGLLLFMLGYQMAGSALLTFDTLDGTSLGVALATTAITLLGVFAMMSALILYVLGKQIDKIQIGEPPRVS